MRTKWSCYYYGASTLGVIHLQPIVFGATTAFRNYLFILVPLQLNNCFHNKYTILANLIWFSTTNFVIDSNLHNIDRHPHYIIKNLQRNGHIYNLSVAYYYIRKGSYAVPGRSVPALLSQTFCPAFLSRDKTSWPGTERHLSTRRSVPLFCPGTERHTFVCIPAL